MQFSSQPFLTKYCTVFLFIYSMFYIPLDGYTISPIKVGLMAISIIMMFFYSLKASKALIIGCIYLITQYLIAQFHPTSFRWSTLIYSFLLVFCYISFYNFVCIEKVFKIEYFIKFLKLYITVFFVVCVIQQVFIVAGVQTFKLINLCYSLDRDLWSNSLAIEPSHFARYMLVAYYAYVKCNEYKRDEGTFTLRELFSGEHRNISLMFLWMMLTMGSGTAFVCLILLSLYFVRWHNWYYVIPVLIISYMVIQESSIEALDRATSTIEATATLDKDAVIEADGSASARITPLLNSLTADFTKVETWLGYGIDSGIKDKYNRTMFHDYGFIHYIISLILCFSCAYNFWSLGTIFMFAGVGGGAGGNVQYLWALMMVMTCVKYFYKNRYNPEIYEEEEVSPLPTPVER